MKSSAIYGILNFLPLASRFFLFPIFVNFLTPFDYGILGLHASVANLMTIIISSGLDSSFSRFYFDYEDSKHELRKYLSTILITISFLGLVVGVIILGVGDQIFRLVFVDDRYTFYPYGIYAYAFAFGTAINAVILIYFRNKEEPIKYLIFTLSTFLLMIAFETYSIFYIQASAENVLIARISGLLLPSIILWISIALKGVYFKKEFLVPAFKYAFPVLVYLLLGFAYLQYDRILVGNLLSIAQLGIYNVAVTIASVLELAMQALDMAVLPTVFRLYKSDEIDKINKIFRYIGYVTLALTSLILIATPYFITEYTPAFYQGTIRLIPLFLIGYLLRFYVNSLNKPLYYFKKLKGLPLVNLAAGVVIILGNLILIPEIGLTGAAISMVLSRLIMVPLIVRLSLKDVGFVHQLGRMNLLIILSSLILVFCAIEFDLIGLPYSSMYIGAFLIGAYPGYLVFKNWRNLLLITKHESEH